MEIQIQNDSQDARIPHVLIFPLPIQGPVKSMLKLAELLIISTNDVHVTFLTTDHVYDRLALSGQATTRFHQHPRFSFQTFSDGLLDDQPRVGDKLVEMLDAVKDVSQPLLRNMLASSYGSSKSNNDINTVQHPVTCIISDGLYDFVVDVGNEARIPVIYFETISPCCLWVYMCLPKLIQMGAVPIRENENVDALVDVVPGMEDYLRRRDLPDFCRVRYKTDHLKLERVLSQVGQFHKAHGIILNTFDELEPHLLSNIRSHYTTLQVYPIGPLHFHLQQKTHMKQNSNSFWTEDKSCMAWLDRQQPKSVLFCSFGSLRTVTKEQLLEFWHGLVNSGCSFLWVKRPGSVLGMEDDYDKWSKEIDEGLVQGINKKGFIVNWAPQEKVLSHFAIGGFLTHSGWNSTIESITMGVPMICWPNYVDQMVVSRVVSEAWKVGIDIKDTCDRVTIEKVVRDVMNLRQREFMENATNLANLAKTSVHESGSSYHSFQCLIEHIRSF